MSQGHCHMADFGVFLSLWNRTQHIKTPWIHFRIANWLQNSWERGDRRLLLQAFRACGKSTLVGVFSAWLLHRDPDLAILVLSAESSLAEKMARTIRKIIERHPLTQILRPSHNDQWASDSFTVNRLRVSRDPSVMARGIAANITGARADVIICDDVEVPNTCGTAEKRQALRERLLENDFILVPGGTILYIGTPHSYYSIYANAPRAELGEDDVFLKGFARLTIPLIDRRGKSAWPERYTEDDIAAMRTRAGPLKFASQMMLEPVNIANSRLDVKLLRRYDDDIVYKEVQKTVMLTLLERRLSSVSAWWDPAFGSASGDSSVLAIVYTDETGLQYVHRVHYIKVSSRGDEDEATLQCRAVVKTLSELTVPIVAVETNGIGKFLPAILRRELALARVPCAVSEKHTARNKAERILVAFDAVMAARSLYVHASVYDTPFLTEMAEWTPGGTRQKDDGLDAVAGALSLEPVRIERPVPAHGKNWSASGGGHAAVTDFDVL